MTRNTFAARLFLLSVLAGGFGAFAVAVANAAEPPPVVALMNTGDGFLEWTSLVDSESITLTLADPQGRVRTFHFGSGEAPALSLFDAQGMPLPDGTYTWELRATPRLGADPKRVSVPLVQSGHFTLTGGNLIASDLPEQPERRLRQSTSSAPRVTTAPDQMVPDDLIVDGKGCIGLGCNNNEVFGQESLRLKQSVVRLRFEDTSAQAGFPARDWQLTVNDSASGGTDRFSIEDLTAGTTPLTLRGGAPNNSLYVDATGRLGLGTATPAEKLHVFENVDANTIITSENSNTGLNAIGALRAKSNAAIVNFQAHGSGRTLSRFGQPLASWAEFLQVTGNGLIVGTLADKPLILGTNNTNRIHLAPNGNTGIGTANPETRLQVEGMSLFHFDDWGNDTVIFRGQKSGPPNNWGEYAIRTAYTGLLFRNTQSGAEMIFLGGGGAVGIGTSSPSSKLHVNGGDVRVSGGSFIDDGVTLNVPDYVFEPDYKLIPLAELKAYIAREKRLPNVPSAQEIKERGLNLSQFQTTLLEKIEELTLYTLAQHEEIAALKDENAKLKARMEALEHSSTATVPGPEMRDDIRSKED